MRLGSWSPGSGTTAGLVWLGTHPGGQTAVGRLVYSAPSSVFHPNIEGSAKYNASCYRTSLGSPARVLVQRILPLSIITLRVVTNPSSNAEPERKRHRTTDALPPLTESERGYYEREQPFRRTNTPGSGTRP